MYHFVDLTDDQKQQRRDRLDWYGLFAQISVLVPLLVVQSFALATWLRRRFAQQSSPEQTPSSPYAKSRRMDSRFDAKEAAKRWSTFLWWCGESCQIAGFHLGTKGELLGATGWMAWLLILTFLQTGDGK